MSVLNEIILSDTLTIPWFSWSNWMDPPRFSCHKVSNSLFNEVSSSDCIASNNMTGEWSIRKDAKESSYGHLQYYPRICLEGLGKTTKTLAKTAGA